MARVTPKEMEAVLKLDGPSRHEHFVKRVVDSEEAWGLWDDGWALMEDDAGQPAFPLWPARAYADLCATDRWSTYTPRRIPLDSLLTELLPALAQKSTPAAIFPTPAGKSVTCASEEVEAVLRSEMKRYQIS